METLIIVFLLLYNAYLVYYLLNEKRQKVKQPEISSESLPKHPEEVDDIVGKSRFRMNTKMPLAAEATPQAAVTAESEEITDFVITFADETDQSTPARLPDDKVDEAFTHLQISDVALVYDENEIEDELPTTGYATGVSFDEIGEAIKIVQDPKATKDESRRAGQVFSELEGNELFNQLIKSSSSRAKKITELMDYFLSNSISRDGDLTGEVVQLQPASESFAGNDEFDIRNFV